MGFWKAGTPLANKKQGDGTVSPIIKPDTYYLIPVSCELGDGDAAGGEYVEMVPKDDLEELAN